MNGLTLTEIAGPWASINGPLKKDCVKREWKNLPVKPYILLTQLSESRMHRHLAAPGKPPNRPSQRKKPRNSPGLSLKNTQKKLDITIYIVYYCCDGTGNNEHI
jgi:hypothetical protein